MTPSRRRKPACRTARWRLEYGIAVAARVGGSILLGFRMPKWKSWLKVLDGINVDREQYERLLR